MIAGRHLRRATSIGGAAAEVIKRAKGDGDQHGQVIGEFRYGHYVRFGDTIFAIGQSPIYPGPLHLIFSGPKPTLRNGAALVLSPESLQTRSVEIDLCSATHWQPQHRVGQDLASELELLGDICASSQTPPGLNVRWDDVQDAAHRGNVSDLVTLLAGLGSGLTPAGDDILAGAFLYSTIFGPDNPDVRHAAAAAETTDLSRAFLHWAARGHSIQPVHTFLRHCANGARAQAEHSAATIRTIGSTSGEALLAGLGLMLSCPVGRASTAEANDSTSR